jgi:hypothetical protein
MSVTVIYYKEIIMSEYRPSYLSWCKSYEEEVAEFRELISGNPADVKLLKQEYESLTGVRFRRKRDE